MSIKVRRLVVRRSSKLILDDITCDIVRGKVTGLLGPSGSGKTTLMRSIIGAQKVQEGSIKIFNKFAGDPELRQRIGYMAQTMSVYSNLSVIENLLYFARILDLPRQEADRVIEVVELAPQRRQTVATLSGGQQARVSLAVALLGSPQILVLDEPTVGLDPLLRHKLWNLFRKLAASGLTLLVSSHVMDEAARCHELLLLRGGQLIAGGTAKKLLKITKTKDLEAAFISLAKGQEASRV